MPELDSSLLLSTLRAELRAAWTAIHAAHSQDGLYGFGVYTTDSASYLMVTAFKQDIHVPGLCILHRVVERLLHDAVEVGFGLGRKPLPVQAAGVELCFDA